MRTEPFHLAVLNPGGNDPLQLFPEGAGIPDEKLHAPTNYHSFAACTSGGFHRDPGTIPETDRHVLLLLRRDLRTCLRALQKLKSQRKIVAVSLKETGLHQVSALLSDSRRLGLFREICAVADGALSTTPDLVAFYRSCRARAVQFLPTPYPTDAPAWNFSTPAAERRGVFIGTREFNVPSRNHFLTVLLARILGQNLTVFNPDGSSGLKILASLGVPPESIVARRQPYPDYLQLLARHRIVFQLDRSAVPGQVAGDALLCRVPCVGGDGAIERIAFPDFCGHDKTTNDLTSIASRLLSDDAFYAESVRSLEARSPVSFETIEPQLRAFFARLS